MVGGDGNDSLSGGLGVDTIDDSALVVNVTINLAAGIASGQGLDSLSGIENALGGSGDDTLTGDGGANVLVGGAGDDTISGGAGNDTIAAGVGHDMLYGGDGDDELAGGDGDDELAGGKGDDSMDGGRGRDLADFSAAAGGVTVNFLSGLATGEGKDTVAGLEDLTGSSGNDFLTGNAGDNSISGGAGNDTVAAGAGNDTISGGTGNDIVDGGSGVDTIDFHSVSVNLAVDLTAGTASGQGKDSLVAIENVYCGSGNDTVVGDAGNNFLQGGAGNDELIGGQGDDILAGGAGVDTSDFSDATSGVIINLSADNATGQGRDQLLDIENAVGGAGDDILTGDSENNLLIGGPGDDRLIGGLGDDTLTGGAGSDTVDYTSASATMNINLVSDLSQGQGRDTLAGIENVAGGAGDDIITGDDGDNILSGGAGDDTLVAGAGNDSVSGDDGDDNISGGTGNDVLAGGSGNDRIDGGTGNDSLTGGAGDDLLAGGSGNDSIAGGAGSDTGDFSSASTGVSVNLAIGVSAGQGKDLLTSLENITGGSGNDALTGDSGANSLTGGAGDDVLSGGDGDDRLIGGSGSDTVDFGNATSSVVVDLFAGKASGQGNDDVTGAENATGGAGGDLLIGNAENNRLSGGDGDDTLLGGGGDDAFDGGIGADTIDFSAAPAPVVVNLVTGSAKGDGADTLTHIENVTGGLGADQITGDGLSNALAGGGGDDVIYGGGGNDRIDGGSGVDTLDLSAVNTNATVDLLAGTAVCDGNATVSGIENVVGGLGSDTLTGDDGVNVLDGGAGNDTLTGGAGNDTLTGGAGNDRLAGGDGEDLLDGGSGADNADVSSSFGDVVVNLMTDVSTGQGTDTLAGIENATGGAGNDTLVGDSNNNVLAGGAGNDTLAGGEGDDVLDGGTGTDTADFADATANLTINLPQHTAIGQGTDALSGIENVICGFGNDSVIGDLAANVISGGAGDDVLAGGAGNDSLLAGDGNDSLSGGPGNDSLSGGAGINTADYSSAIAGLSVNLSTGVAAGQGRDTLEQITNVIGGTGPDTLTGNTDGNALNGGAGNDILIGADGDDALVGGDGSDTIDNSLAVGDLVVNLALGSATGQGNDTLFTIENVIGGSGNDTLTGDDGDNILSGGKGDDILLGGAGNDSLLGGDGDDNVSGELGDDVVSGGDGLDTLNESVALDPLVINLASGLETGMGRDVLSGIENVIGGAGNDTITGDRGDNVLAGGDGDDILVGGAGVDQMIGGAGVNTCTREGSEVTSDCVWDDVAPTLSNLAIKVDVAKGKQTAIVTVTFEVRDSGVGFAGQDGISVVVGTGQGSGGWSDSSPTMVSQVGQVAEFTSTHEVPLSALTQHWSVTSMTIADAAGNAATLTSDALSGAGYQVDVTVPPATPEIASQPPVVRHAAATSVALTVAAGAAAAAAAAGAAAASAAAASAASAAAGGVGGAAGSAGSAGGAGGGSGGAAGRSEGGGSGSSPKESSATEVKKIRAGAAASVDLGDSGPGDDLALWGFAPFIVLDAPILALSRRLSGKSPLLAKVVNDAAYLRALIGVAWSLLPLAAVVLGTFAAQSAGPVFGLPAFVLLAGLVTIGAFDSFAALVGILLFVMTAAVRASHFTWADGRLALGLIGLVLGPSMLAIAFRSIRRPAARSVDSWFERITDVVMVPLIGAWAMHALISLTTMFSTRDLGIMNHRHALIALVAGALVMRTLAEEGAARFVPGRLAHINFDKPVSTSVTQKHVSTLLRSLILVFLLASVIGNNWALYVGGGIYAAAWFAGLWRDRLPNLPWLFQLLPADMLLLVVGLTFPILAGTLVPEESVHRELHVFVVGAALSTALACLGLLGRAPKPAGIRWYRAPRLRPLYWLITAASVGLFAQVGHISELWS